MAFCLPHVNEKPCSGAETGSPTSWLPLLFTEVLAVEHNSLLFSIDSLWLAVTATLSLGLQLLEHGLLQTRSAAILECGCSCQSQPSDCGLEAAP